MKFRSDANDRRAVAVIAVVLYHFSVPHVADGFRGIDVFFVVSGFLMTGIVFRGIEKGRSYVLQAPCTKDRSGALIVLTPP